MDGSEESKVWKMRLDNAQTQNHCKKGRLTKDDNWCMDKWAKKMKSTHNNSVSQKRQTNNKSRTAELTRLIDYGMVEMIVFDHDQNYAQNGKARKALNCKN